MQISKIYKLIREFTCRWGETTNQQNNNKSSGVKKGQEGSGSDGSGGSRETLDRVEH